MAFAHAQNAHIYDSSFTDIGGNLNVYNGNVQTNYTTLGDMVIHQSETGASLLYVGRKFIGEVKRRHQYPIGLRALSQAATTGASFDSQERYPPPKCHPGTRRAILHDIRRWIDHSPGDAMQRENVLWIHGPAGAGKSAIAQTVCELYAERKELAASFFFSRIAPGRNDATYLFTTLAYQLAMCSRSRRRQVQAIIENDPLIVHKTTSIRIQRLIIDPYHSPDEDPSSLPFLVVIDGLDECGGNKDQTQVLSHVLELALALPLYFIIVSRPEPHIRHSFDGPIMQNISTSISLYGTAEAVGDVYMFLRSGFDAIHDAEQHSDIMQFVQKPWPSDDVVNLLARRSGGYFIYASTVLKFLDEEYFSPVLRLNEVLKSSTSTSEAFAELDKLYQQILSTCRNSSLVIRILSYLLISSHGTPNSFHIEAVFNLGPGELLMNLRGLHSILRVDTLPLIGRESHIETLHASFPDFLFDKNRAGRFFIDAANSHGDIVDGTLNLIEEWDQRSARYNKYVSYHRLISSIKVIISVTQLPHPEVHIHQLPLPPISGPRPKTTYRSLA